MVMAVLIIFAVTHLVCLISTTSHMLFVLSGTYIFPITGGKMLPLSLAEYTILCNLLLFNDNCILHWSGPR